MSLQRAYINCQRCYGLVKPHANQMHSEADKEAIIREMNEDDQLYTARNETMKALETVVSNFDLRDSIEHNVNARRNISDEAMCERSQASSLLDACKGCDYKSPTIADLLDIAEVDQPRPNYNK
jgi:hypothetical protein